MREVSDYGVLRGVEKVAAFLLTLSEDQIGKILSHMDEWEIKEISLAMSQLGRVSSTVTEVLFRDVVDHVQSAGGLVGNLDTTEKLLSKLLDTERANDIMEEIRGPAGRTMWDKLANVSEELLANYLKNEYPQTIAVILSKIRTEHGAKVLAIMPEQLSMEVVLRMLRMEMVSKDIIQDIERTLRTEFMSNISRANKRDSHELIAEIFNNFDRPTEARFMTSLEERNPEASERVKALMFTFDDLVKVNDTGFQEIIRTADKSKLCLALKGANETIKDLFFKNMSERAAKIMREDIASLGMVRVKDVDDAQATIVKTAKDLANAGKIVINKGGGEDEAMI